MRFCSSLHKITLHLYSANQNACCDPEGEQFARGNVALSVRIDSPASCANRFSPNASGTGDDSASSWSGISSVHPQSLRYLASAALDRNIRCQTRSPSRWPRAISRFQRVIGDAQQTGEPARVLEPPASLPLRISFPDSPRGESGDDILAAFRCLSDEVNHRDPFVPSSVWIGTMK